MSTWQGQPKPLHLSLLVSECKKCMVGTKGVGGVECDAGEINVGSLWDTMACEPLSVYITCAGILELVAACYRSHLPIVLIQRPPQPPPPQPMTAAPRSFSATLMAFLSCKNTPRPLLPVVRVPPAAGMRERLALLAGRRPVCGGHYHRLQGLPSDWICSETQIQVVHVTGNTYQMPFRGLFT